MKLSFHGAVQTVTGSKHLLQLDSGFKILFDCGMFQGHPKESDQLNRHWGFEPSSVDVVFLTHGHIDHCGLLPKLVKDGFRGKIYCSHATRDLAEILLLDSAHIQEMDLKYVNKRRAKQGKEPYEVLYTEYDVRECLKFFECVKKGEWVKISNEVELLLTEAGHILGSTVVNVRITEKNKRPVNITFSGDVGRYNDEILRSPEPFPQADYLILESTYGDSLHEPSEMSASTLLDIITHTCVRKKGRLIIPAFSVGRTQEIAYMLNRLEIDKVLPDIDFYIDSPLSIEATQLLREHTECYNKRFLKYMEKDPEPFDFHRLHYISKVEDSIALNQHDRPCVIISASGMADAGRVKHHIKHAINDPKNTILMVGYCEPNSLGARLVRGQLNITIFGEIFEVKAEIRSMRSFSAHADYDDLCQFIACQNPKEVKQLFIVHGELDTQRIFREKLLQKGFPEVVIPEMHQEFYIN
ncbi:MAG TPA: MBL fold metallo-hydrolase [Flavobacteriales bacterium]